MIYGKTMPAGDSQEIFFRFENSDQLDNCDESHMLFARQSDGLLAQAVKTSAQPPTRRAGEVRLR
jgi:hypothetical protein